MENLSSSARLIHIGMEDFLCLLRIEGEAVFVGSYVLQDVDLKLTITLLYPEHVSVLI